MKVLKVKYALWAANMDRAIQFYSDLFDAQLSFRTEVWSELLIGDAIIGLHGDGEGKRTWTGLTFQLDDLRTGVDRLLELGGQLARPLDESSEEELHLAMCVDPEGNEFMMTQPRAR
jgi:lactoylglutathione lyase